MAYPQINTSMKRKKERLWMNHCQKTKIVPAPLSSDPRSYYHLFRDVQCRERDGGSKFLSEGIPSSYLGQIRQLEFGK